MADRLLYRGEQVLDAVNMNRALGLVGQTLPHFFAPESPFICANGALNYVGALLMARNMPYYEQQIGTYKHEPELHVRIPARLISAEIVHQGVLIPSATILHKRSHGIGDKEYGLVLEGELAGTFVWFNGEKAYPERIFNDERIPPDQKKYRPYTPIFVEDEDDGVLELTQRLEQTYKEQYYALVDEVRNALGKPKLWTTDLLFHLCGQLRIPIDRSHFHSTRTG